MNVLWSSPAWQRLRSAALLSASLFRRRHAASTRVSGKRPGLVRSLAGARALPVGMLALFLSTLLLPACGTSATPNGQAAAALSSTAAVSANAVAAFGRFPVNTRSKAIEALGKLTVRQYFELDGRTVLSQDLTDLANKFPDMQSLWVANGIDLYTLTNTPRPAALALGYTKFILQNWDLSCNYIHSKIGPDLVEKARRLAETVYNDPQNAMIAPRDLVQAVTAAIRTDPYLRNDDSANWADSYVFNQECFAPVPVVTQ